MEDTPPSESDADKSNEPKDPHSPPKPSDSARLLLDALMAELNLQEDEGESEDPADQTGDPDATDPA